MQIRTHTIRCKKNFRFCRLHPGFPRIREWWTGRKGKKHFIKNKPKSRGVLLGLPVWNHRQETAGYSSVVRNTSMSQNVDHFLR